jgi:ATP-dependent DNA ligase
MIQVASDAGNRVHWVRPELVAEVKYLTWTDDNLLRQVVYEGLREDKPAVGCGGRRRIPERPTGEGRTAASKKRMIRRS